MGRQIAERCGITCHQRIGERHIVAYQSRGIYFGTLIFLVQSATDEQGS